MKLWVLVGFFTAVSIPWAAASETTECGLDTRQTRVEAPAAAAPEPREERKAVRSNRQEEGAATATAQRAAPRVEARRRGGSVARRIPDAMLIDGRGAL